MKFGIARNDNIICKHCGGTILYGEEYVGVFWKSGEIRRSMFFHVGCYPIWLSNHYQKKLETWRQAGKSPAPGRGRPKKWTNPELANKLNRLIRYHAEQGNLDKVRKFERQMESLRVK